MPVPNLPPAWTLAVAALGCIAISCATSPYRRSSDSESRPGVQATTATMDAADGAPASESASPAFVVEQLLETHFAGDMSFDPTTVGPKREALSPELWAAQEAYFARPRSGDEPPPVNGDPFTDTQEYPTRFAVQAPEFRAGLSRVPVRYDDEYRSRTVTFVLREIDGEWLVDDIVYEDGGTFRELLRE